MIGQVRAIGKGGQGIVMSAGKPVFIDRVIPGESVEYEITGKRHSVWFGSLVKIIQASDDRVTPPCGYYSRCGGCNFQHISYSRQVQLKKDILSNNLKKIARMSRVPRIRELTSPPFNYRTKMVLKVRNGKIGFLQRKSHRLVEINKCLLLPGNGEDLIASLNDNPLVKKAADGEILALSSGEDFSALLRQNHSARFLTGRRAVSFSVRGYRYRFRPDNFIQANRFTLADMVELVEQQFKKKFFQHALDLYSGTGFFTLPLSCGGSHVVAIDIDSGNLDSLAKNLRANGISNVKLLQADIDFDTLPGADLVLADPPRTGLHPRVIAQMVRKPGASIIYFSCDSATFSRDIAAFLAGGYRMSGLTLIDNFPQTDHFEIFCRLKNAPGKLKK